MAAMKIPRRLRRTTNTLQPSPQPCPPTEHSGISVTTAFRSRVPLELMLNKPTSSLMDSGALYSVCVGPPWRSLLMSPQEEGHTTHPGFCPEHLHSLRLQSFHPSTKGENHNLGAGVSQQLRAQIRLPPPTWQLTTHFNSNSKGSVPLFCPSQEMHTLGRQAHMQAKHAYT